MEALIQRNVKNTFMIEVYSQVCSLTHFSFETLLLLEEYDMVASEKEAEEAFTKIMSLRVKFNDLRNNLEKVYSQTRILNKPKDYILDQDHYHHPANQTINFDWQFYSELLFLIKLKSILKITFLEKRNSYYNKKLFRM